MERYEYGYWASYDEAKQIARGDPKPSLEDTAEPTSRVDIVEPHSVREAQGWKEASGGWSSEPMMVVSTEPDVIIVYEIAAESLTHLPKNSVDVTGPSAPPTVDVVEPSAPPKDLVNVARPSMPPP